MPANYWVNKEKQFNALQTRERVIVVGSLFFGLYFLFSLLGFDPTKDDIKKLEGEWQEKNLKITALKAEQQLLEKMLNRDPVKPLKNDLETLNAQITQLDAAIAKVAEGFVPAGQLPVMLKEVLNLTNSVQLEQVFTLPPQKIPLQPNDVAVAAVKTVSESVTEQAPSVNNSITLYRQGVVLNLKGDYGSLLNAIQKIEESPWHLYWEVLRYSVTDYPTASMQLQLYTLTHVNYANRSASTNGEEYHAAQFQPH